MASNGRTVRHRFAQRASASIAGPTKEGTRRSTRTSTPDWRKTRYKWRESPARLYKTEMVQSAQTRGSQETAPPFWLPSGSWATHMLVVLSPGYLLSALIAPFLSYRGGLDSRAIYIAFFANLAYWFVLIFWFLLW